MSTPLRRRWRWLLGGVALAVLLSVVAVGLYTRTDWGRARILAITLEALGGRLNGELVVERLEGNVITGAHLYGVALRDAQGEDVLVADSAFLAYEVPTLLGGDVVINRLDIYDATLHLVRLPGDTLWNYQHVLQDTTGVDPSARATLIESLRLRSTRVTVRQPWEPVEERDEQAREREIEAALADTSRLVVERVPQGFLRTMRFRVEDAALSELIIANDARGGTSLQVDGATGTAFLWSEPPLHLHLVQGRLAVREGVMRYHASVIRLPESQFSSSGVVDTTGDEPAYDLLFVGEEVALADLQWLYPRFPDEGEAQFRLWLETHPEGLFVRARDLQASMEGTRLRGEFGMLVGDTVRFVDTELTASPLNVRTVERMLPTELPVRGLRIGTLEVRG